MARSNLDRRTQDVRWHTHRTKVVTTMSRSPQAGLIKMAAIQKGGKIKMYSIT